MRHNSFFQVLIIGLTFLGMSAPVWGAGPELTEANLFDIHSVKEYRFGWDLYSIFSAIEVTHPDGLDKLGAAVLIDPDGNTYHLYDDGSNCDNIAGDGRYHGCNGDGTSPPAFGEYTIKVSDVYGNVLEMNKNITAVADYTQTISPGFGECVTSSTPTFSFDAAPSGTTGWLNVSTATGNPVWSRMITAGTDSVQFNDDGNAAESLQSGVTYYWAVSFYDAEGNEGRRNNIPFQVGTPNTFYVDGGFTGTSDGSASAPFQTIGDAIAQAGFGDTINVAQGTYSENPAIQNIPLFIYGGFESAGWTRDIQSYETIIDGGAQNTVIELNESSSVIDGFTIQNGQGGSGGAGGINTNWCSWNVGVEVRNCTIIQNDNSATDWNGAGGIYFKGGYLTLSDCIIMNNSIGSGPGGLRADGAHLIVKDTLILQNGNNVGVGLGSSTTRIEGCTVTRNPGGGLHVWNGEADIKNSIFWYNWMNSWDAGIYVDDADMEVSYSNMEQGWSGVGNINTDPLFCDPDNNDFSLASNSPCLGAGEGGADMGAFGQGSCGTGTAKYILEWWGVSRREYTGGTPKNSAPFVMLDQGANFVAEDIVSSYSITDPDSQTVTLTSTGFAGSYDILSGRYYGNDGRWVYDDGFGIESYYNADFTEPIKAGTYTLNVMDTNGDSHTATSNYSFPGGTLPAADASTFKTHTDSAGNFFLTWDPVSYINPSFSLGARMVLGAFNDQDEYQAEIYLRFPPHLGSIYIPAAFFNEFKAKGTYFITSIQIRSGMDRNYSEIVRLDQIDGMPLLGDIDNNRKIDAAEAVYGLRGAAELLD